MKKIAIIGAGISGLSLAYFLEQLLPTALDITIFEKDDEVGGYLKTKVLKEAIFECGPRTIRNSSKELTSLIKALDLESEILAASSEAKKRYIAYRGKLEALPSSMHSLFTSKLGRKALLALLREPFAKRGDFDDESVESFFSRRIGKKATSIFISALTAGIYAETPDKLSMRSCFTSLWEHEKKYRSLLRYRSDSKQHSFTFKAGMQSLPKRLKERIGAKIVNNFDVQSIKEYADRVVVNEEYEYDYIFSTIGHPGIAKTSVVAVSAAFEDQIPIPSGFGFLCPKDEEHHLLGCIFDSNLFSGQNGGYKTRLSLMFKDLIGYSDDVITAYSVEALRKYLGICKEADFLHILRHERAISAYPVGHYKTCEYFSQMQGRQRFIGSALYGVSIGDSVTSASIAAREFTKNYLTNNVSNK